MGFNGTEPLVNIQETMENHGFPQFYSWVNQLFLWQFSIATLNYQSVFLLFDHLFDPPAVGSNRSSLGLNIHPDDGTSVIPCDNLGDLLTRLMKTTFSKWDDPPIFHN